MGNSNSTPLAKCLTAVFAATNPSDVSYPSNPLYQLEYVKPYNLDIAVTPAAVTRPKSNQQVADVVTCAVQNGARVQAKSGGHSYGNYGLGGTSGAVVIDLQHFQQYSIDTSTWQATVGAGTLLGDVTKRMHSSGRAMAHGTCPQVGIGGHATIGGLGPTSRMWGSALDHVQEVTVVLANSTIATASEDINPDLFFALKGAAASFGIITEFKVRTEHEPPSTVQYEYTFSLGSNYSDLANAFDAWQTLISDPNLSRKFASQVLLSPLGLVIQGTFFGSQAEFNSLGLAQRVPRASSSSVVLKDWLGNVAQWADRSAEELGGGISVPFYAKSLAFRNDTLLTSQNIRDIFSYVNTADKGSLLWAIIFDLEGGAINDVPPTATSYGHRDALFYMQSYIVGIPHVSQTAKNFLAGLNNAVTNSFPGADLGAYAGYVDPLLQNAQEQYWGVNYPRLQQIKRKYDPENVFSNPQSVQPAKS